MRREQEPAGSGDEHGERKPKAYYVAKLERMIK
jgi:hypothetical protein